MCVDVNSEWKFLDRDSIEDRFSIFGGASTTDAHIFFAVARLWIREVDSEVTILLHSIYYYARGKSQIDSMYLFLFGIKHSYQKKYK